MDNSTSDSREAPAAHPLGGADWAPLAALLDRSLADHGHPLPEGLAIAIVADVWRRLAAPPAA